MSTTVNWSEGAQPIDFKCLNVRYMPGAPLFYKKQCCNDTMFTSDPAMGLQVFLVFFLSL